MSKIIVFDEEVKIKLLQGADIIAGAIRVTYGPRGHNVVVGFRPKLPGAPVAPPNSTKDGVIVAKELETKDRFVNMGVSLVKEAARKTGNEVGDGSTTSALLAHGILSEGIKLLAAGADGMSLKHGIEKATRCVVEELRRQAKPVTTREQLVKIASIAAHDAEIGETIVSTVESVGKNGVVNVEAGQGLGIETECVEGTRFDRGFLSPYFINRPETQEAVIDEPYILITDKKLSSLSDLLPALETITRFSKSLVIIAADVDSEALATLVSNKLKGTLSCLAVQAPGFAEYGRAMLEDLAILTGGQYIASDKGLGLDSISLKDLGRARRVIANKDHTTIIEGRGDPAAIQARVEQIMGQLRNYSHKYVTTQDYERKRFEERLARLSGGIATIRVGAPTQLEQQEKWHRVEGALTATKAAALEGTLPGGGIAYINAIPALKTLALTGDELYGANIVKKALEAPLRQLAVNAGYNGTIVLDVIHGSKPGFGFDVISEDYGDMEEKGILDAAKVVCLALQNAASTATLALITEALISIKPESKPPA